MQTELYEKIKQGLQEYFGTLGLSKSLSPEVVGFAPANPNYPLIVIDELDNTPYQNMAHRRQSVSSVSYKVDVYAKTSGSGTKQEIARELAKYCISYLTSIGLKQVSYNPLPTQGTNGAIYCVTIMFTARYFENKQYFV